MKLVSSVVFVLLQLNVHEMLRLDYISCALTVVSTVLVGKKLWQGWVVAGANSVIICAIGMRTAQFGFVPANVFCLALYGYNLWHWRKR
jgi:hypothetical protein